MRLVSYAILIALALFALFPLGWMTLSSLKSYQEIYRFPPTYWPSDFGFGFYERVLSTTPFLSFLAQQPDRRRALDADQRAFASMAAWSLARARFRGRTLLMRSVLLAYLFPQILIVIPLFAAIARLGLADSYAGLILAYVTFTFPFSTWMLTAYFEKIPHEIEEAGRIDGASNWTIFTRLVLPLAAPGIVTVAIFAFINAWNEFLYALVILGGGERRTCRSGSTASSAASSRNGGR